MNQPLPVCPRGNYSSVFPMLYTLLSFQSREATNGIHLYPIVISLVPYHYNYKLPFETLDVANP